MKTEKASNKDILKKYLIEKILKLNSSKHLANNINQLPAYDLTDLSKSLPDAKRISIWNLINTSLKSEILLEVHWVALASDDWPHCLFKELTL